MTNMQEYIIEIRRTLGQIFIGGTGVCAGLYVAGFGQFIPGLLLGIFTSTIYYLLMCYRVGKSADMPANKAISYMRAGWFYRLFFIVLMLMLSLKIQNINFWSAVIGLLFLQMIMFFKIIFVIIQNLFGALHTASTDACLQVSWDKRLEGRRKEDGTRWRN